MYVLIAAPGKQFGELLMHPEGEGKNILDSRAADDHSFIKEILASVARVTDIMAAITTASTEPSAGIELVDGAIVEMDDSTRHNAALVEQASAAAQRSGAGLIRARIPAQAPRGTGDQLE